MTGKNTLLFDMAKKITVFLTIQQDLIRKRRLASILLLLLLSFKVK